MAELMWNPDLCDDGPGLSGDEQVWWARQDSNLQPIGYEPTALTIELQAPRKRL